MKRKKGPKRKLSTRRLIALAAVAATVWTVSGTANWKAVAATMSGLWQGTGLVEQIVRQELIQPVENGKQMVLSAWEQLVVTESPQLLSSQSAVNQRMKETGTATAVTETEEKKNRQAAEKEQRAKDSEQKKEATAEKKAPEKKKAGSAKLMNGKLDSSKLKASDIQMDNHTTGISVKASSYFNTKANLTLKSAKKGPQILIMHTHATEAYTKGKNDTYKETDTARTTDNGHNMVRVGEEIKSVFEDMGLSVVHDKTQYDYPRYNGCYARALTGIEKELKAHPTIQVVLDIHRDATMGSSQAETDEVDGEQAAHVMLVVGTNDMGLAHPHWKDHLALAVQIQKNMLAIDGELPRPIDLRRQRFNEHAAPGSLLVEVGSNGNTLQQALAGARLFARAAGSLYLSCVKK